MKTTYTGNILWYSDEHGMGLGVLIHYELLCQCAKLVLTEVPSVEPSAWNLALLTWFLDEDEDE